MNRYLVVLFEITDDEVIMESRIVNPEEYENAKLFLLAKREPKVDAGYIFDFWRAEVKEGFNMGLLREDLMKKKNVGENND